MSISSFGIQYLSSIGNTPLFRMNRFCPDGHLYAKAEWYNPSGSIKARTADYIIKTAIQRGKLTKDKILLDATSANAGIAYAMIGFVLGYRVKLCMPESITTSSKRIISFYHADVVFTDPNKSLEGAIEEAKRLSEEEPDQYFYADQYANDANWKAHFKTTGPEIYTQTQQKITHFVAGIGTSETLFGCGSYLKKANSSIKLVEVQTDTASSYTEAQDFDLALHHQFYDETFADQKIVCTAEDAYQVIHEVAEKEGVIVSASSAACLYVARQVACDNPNGVVVTILPDDASKYLEEDFWNQPRS